MFILFQQSRKVKVTEKELILTSILNCSRSEIYFKAQPLNSEELGRFNCLMEKRADGEPLQYLLGFSEFMGIRLKVDSRALIPRPETEILVEETLKAVKDLNLRAKNVLDIGTGCANIAVALAKFLPEAEITALDISGQALELARENAVLNQVEERIKFLRMDFLSSEFSKENYPAFDILVSNPPYIKTADLIKLPKDVRQEPLIALDGGSNGLKFYRAIIKKAEKLLQKNGLLALEIGYKQSKPVAKMLEESNRLNIFRIIKDYAGIERVIIARLTR